MTKYSHPILGNIIFFCTNLSQDPLKKLLIMPILLLKWKKLLYWLFCQDKRIFVRFVKLLISLDEYGIFLSHLKSVFFSNDRELTENYIQVTVWKVSKHGNFSGPYFLRIKSGYWKIRPEKTPYPILFTQGVLLSRRTINRLLRATANIHLRKFRFKKRLKLV